MTTLVDRLDNIAHRYDEIDALMADPEVIADYTRLNELAQERSELDPLITAYRRYKDVLSQIEDSKMMMEDDDRG